MNKYQKILTVLAFIVFSVVITLHYVMMPHPGAYPGVHVITPVIDNITEPIIALVVLYAIGVFALADKRVKRKQVAPVAQPSAQPSNESPELTVSDIIDEQQAMVADTRLLDDFMEANGGSVLDPVWDFVYNGEWDSAKGKSWTLIKIAFETYAKWKADREAHLQAIRRAPDLKAIREACQQYERWRQSYWTRPSGAEGPPEGPIYNP
jgi:hypothetical protein